MCEQIELSHQLVGGTSVQGIGRATNHRRELPESHGNFKSALRETPTHNQRTYARTVKFAKRKIYRFTSDIRQNYGTCTGLGESRNFIRKIWKSFDSSHIIANAE